MGLYFVRLFTIMLVMAFVGSVCLGFAGGGLLWVAFLLLICLLCFDLVFCLA